MGPINCFIMCYYGKENLLDSIMFQYNGFFWIFFIIKKFMLLRVESTMTPTLTEFEPWL